MVCSRCGETNTGMALLCRHCGAPLVRQAGAGAVEDLADDQLSIDKLPTMLVPGVAGGESFAPTPRLPFEQQFPLELDAAGPLEIAGSETARIEAAGDLGASTPPVTQAQGSAAGDLARPRMEGEPALPIEAMPTMSPDMPAFPLEMAQTMPPGEPALPIEAMPTIPPEGPAFPLPAPATEPPDATLIRPISNAGPAGIFSLPSRSRPLSFSEESPISPDRPSGGLLQNSGLWRNLGGPDAAPAEEESGSSSLWPGEDEQTLLSQGRVTEKPQPGMFPSSMWQPGQGRVTEKPGAGMFPPPAWQPGQGRITEKPGPGIYSPPPWQAAGPESTFQSGGDQPQQPPHLESAGQAEPFPPLRSGPLPARPDQPEVAVPDPWQTNVGQAGPALVGMNTPLPATGAIPEWSGIQPPLVPHQPGSAQPGGAGVGPIPSPEGYAQMPPRPGQPFAWPPLTQEQVRNIYAANPGPSNPVYQAAPLEIPEGQSALHPFVQPLPRWLSLGLSVLGALLLPGLIFLNPDWATGAVMAAVIAVILAVLLLIGTGVRVALGLLQENNPRRKGQIINIVVLLALLALFSGLGLSQQTGLHLVQGRYLEAHQSWAMSIAEYQAGGETDSGSTDVARVYNEWGEAQIGLKQYAGAVTSFQAVLADYQQSGQQYTRARADIVTAYMDWGAQAAGEQDYGGATAHYDALLALSFCGSTTTCGQHAQTADATAYYHLAEQRLAQKQYGPAVQAYQTLVTRFPTAPESGQVHAHYAQALWGLGQSQLGTTCSDAVSTYRKLSRSFADTPQGQRAITALAQPVPVTGRFTQTIPATPARPTVYLVKGVFVNISNEEFAQLLVNAPQTSIQGDGSFHFAQVPQGSYTLVWTGDAATLHYYFGHNGQKVLYTAHVGPLCTFSYGDVNEPLPTN